jgi:hypothetical protein
MKFSAAAILMIAPLFALALPLNLTRRQGEAEATCPPEVNQATIDLIKGFEGFVASPEPDPIGLPTVGKCSLTLRFWTSMN